MRLKAVKPLPLSQEGRHVGVYKGFEIGQEVGFYRGCIRVRRA